MQETLEKILTVFVIMAFKHVAGIFLNSDAQTYDQKSTRYQTVLGFDNWLKEMFSESICLRIIENYNEGAAVLILLVFVTCQHVDSWKVF